MTGPEKHSLTLRGHRTSVTLEPEFWQEFRAIAAKRGQSINALAAELDATRAGGLASSMRRFVLQSAALPQIGRNEVAMPHNILLLVAMPEELAQSPRADMRLIHMGVGKVNAAWRTAQALETHRPDLVINFGTAGALRAGITGLVEVGAAVQRDMDVRALGLDLGHTPFEDDSPKITFAAAPWVCGTGDSFANTAPELACDLVDMELYAIAKICRAQNIPLRAFKYISDTADSTAPQDWRAALDHAAAAFVAHLETL